MDSNKLVTMAASEIKGNNLYVDGDADLEAGPKASPTVSVDNPTFTNIPGLTTDEANELVRATATALGDNHAAHAAVIHLVAGLRRGHEKARLRTQKSTITLGELTVNDPLLEGYGDEVKTIIVSEFNKIDTNLDGKIDRKEIVQFAGNTATRSLASASRIKSLRHAIFGLLGGGAFLAAVVFALSVAAAFFAKDTNVGAGNVLTARGSGGPVRTAPVTTDVRAFAPHEATDAAAPSAEAAGTKSLGCIAGDAVEATAADSLRSPVLLTSPDGSVHKLEGHDLEWDGEGGVSIRESSGLVYTIQKDPACAASSEGRRLANVNLSAFRVMVRNGACEITGTDRDDTIHGTSGGDSLKGSGGDDTMHGGNGEDRLYGNAGADRVFGEAGDDHLYGGNAGDHLHGGVGVDHLYGELGNDHLYGGADVDFLSGGNGQDILDGGADVDILYGGAGQDTLKGGDGSDRLTGGGGDDTAVFDGNMDDYRVELLYQVADGSDFQYDQLYLQVVDKYGSDTDRLYEMEVVQFADRTCAINSRFFGTLSETDTRPLTYMDELWEGGECQLHFASSPSCPLACAVPSCVWSGEDGPGWDSLWSIDEDGTPTQNGFCTTFCSPVYDGGSLRLCGTSEWHRSGLDCSGCADLAMDPVVPPEDRAVSSGLCAATVALSGHVLWGGDAVQECSGGPQGTDDTRCTVYQALNGDEVVNPGRTCGSFCSHFGLSCINGYDDGDDGCIYGGDGIGCDDEPLSILGAGSVGGPTPDHVCACGPGSNPNPTSPKSQPAPTPPPTRQASPPPNGRRAFQH